MPFDPKRYEKVQEVLGDPDMYPSELLSWMLKKLQDNPYFMHRVGGPGEPAFQNGWVNYDPNFSPAGFWKDPWGTVHLSGLVKDGTFNAAMFTLPVGYRPEYGELFGVENSGGHARIDVNPNGVVNPVGGSSGYVQLSGITFRAFS